MAAPTNGESNTANKKKPKKLPWKKPKGMPKRPLSAYNLFFAEERQRIIEEERALQDSQDQSRLVKVGFANLARKVAAKWKLLSPEEKQPFLEVAAKEKLRYKAELKVWRDVNKLTAVKPALQKDAERKSKTVRQVSDSKADDMSEVDLREKQHVSSYTYSRSPSEVSDALLGEQYQRWSGDGSQLVIFGRSLRQVEDAVDLASTYLEPLAIPDLRPTENMSVKSAAGLGYKILLEAVDPRTGSPTSTLPETRNVHPHPTKAAALINSRYCASSSLHHNNNSSNEAHKVESEMNLLHPIPIGEMEQFWMSDDCSSYDCSKTSSSTRLFQQLHGKLDNEEVKLLQRFARSA